MTPPYTLFSVATLLLLVGCSEGFYAAQPSPESPPDPTWDTAAPETAVLETGDSAVVDSADSGDSSPPPEQDFWHIERPGDSARTWLVSPEGARTFVLGVNTVMRDVTCDGILDNYIRRMEPSRAANREWARLATGSSGGEEVEHPYCFNSVGAFSESNDFDETGGDSYMIRPAGEGGAGAPYGVVLNPAATGDAWALKDESGAVLRPGYSGYRMGDPWNPAFLADLDAMVDADVKGRVDDPALQMWFLGNELGIFDRTTHDEQGVRDFRRHIWSDCPETSTPEAPECAPHALVAFLSGLYAGSLADLNAAWESDYPGEDFVVITETGPRPVPYEHDCNLQCRYDLQNFVHDALLAEWVRAVTTRVRAADPKHLLSSPRLALASASTYRFWSPASSDDPDYWADEPDTPVPTDSAQATYCPFDLLARDGDSGFDLVSVNVYEGGETYEEPWFGDGIDKLSALSGLPIFVSEFSVRARLDGWSNEGGAESFVSSADDVEDQGQRGDHYQSQVAQFASHPQVVGASWHAWSDRYAADDPDHQMNLGLMQCDDPAHGYEAGQRWDQLDDRIAETNCAIEEVIAGATGL